MIHFYPKSPWFAPPNFEGSCQWTLSARFGRTAVTVGIEPGAGSSFTGTKIAFNRVPDVSEFDEKAPLSAAHFAETSKAKKAAKDG